MKILTNIIGAASFFVSWGIVGKIEHGGSLSLAVWLIPLIAAFCACVIAAEKKEQEGKK